jgi:hypothetical protein
VEELEFVVHRVDRAVRKLVQFKILDLQSIYKPIALEKPAVVLLHHQPCAKRRLHCRGVEQCRFWTTVPLAFSIRDSWHQVYFGGER